MSEPSLRDREAILASLSRVAALVAGGTESTEVFAAIAREVADLLELPLVEVSRFEPDGTATVIGAWSERAQPFVAGTRWPLDGPTISGLVKETGAPARVEDYTERAGTIADGNGQLPSYGKMLKDQIEINDSAEEIEASVAKGYRDGLY